MGIKRGIIEILFYDMQFFRSQQWTNYDPNFVLDPINLYPNTPNSIYYQSGNPDPNPNQYSSNVHSSGFYISSEVNPMEQMKLILGLRAENYVQRHTGRDQKYASGDLESGSNLDNDIVLESFRLFPSVNMIYSVAERQNIRPLTRKQLPVHPLKSSPLPRSLIRYQTGFLMAACLLTAIGTVI